MCPVEAIYYEDDLPDVWADYYKANVEFFDEIGSPGGAAKVGALDFDHPLVAALAPQGDGHWGQRSLGGIRAGACGC